MKIRESKQQMVKKEENAYRKYRNVSLRYECMWILSREQNKKFSSDQS